MTMVDTPTSFILFHDAPAADGHVGADDPLSNSQSAEFLRAREQAERAAAKQASSTAARLVHQALAQSCARRLGKVTGGSVDEGN